MPFQKLFQFFFVFFCRLCRSFRQWWIIFSINSFVPFYAHLSHPFQNFVMTNIIIICDWFALPIFVLYRNESFVPSFMAFKSFSLNFPRLFFLSTPWYSAPCTIWIPLFPGEERSIPSEGVLTAGGVCGILPSGTSKVSDASVGGFE